MPYKPQVNIFAICERVVLDQRGKPSLLGIFDVLNVSTFPAAFPFFLFAQVTASPGEYRIAVHISSDDGIPQKLFEDVVRVEEDPGVANVTGNLTPVFSHAGVFEFRLYIDNIPKITRPFHVRKAN